MLSVILTGRNDNYGYNQHKRLAISVNGIAHLLDLPDDEIVFVDYNTRDDHPTALEAINDTLTPRARAITRVLRVRPELHARFSKWTPLALIDVISRNIGIRRTAANRWILSTTTDVVFVPRQSGKTLSSIVADLPDGFYGLPRFDLPETLWEQVNRSDPATFLQQFKAWGRDLQIDEIVRSVPAIGFDGPGDFQLVLRADMLRFGAFDERMLLGWHMDANLWRRLGLVYPSLSSLEDHLAGYHCDHTRTATPNHRSDARIENNTWRFVETVDRPDLPHQDATWGVSDAKIEEISLNKEGSAEFANRLLELSAAGGAAYESKYTADSFNTVEYVLAHVFPFVSSQIAPFPPSATVGYLGINDVTASMLASFQAARGGAVLCLGGLLSTVPTGARAVDFEELLERCGLFVIDFGLATDAPEKLRRMCEVSEAQIQGLCNLEGLFLTMVRRERARTVDLGDATAAKSFIVINAVHTQFEQTVSRELAVTLTPFSSRLRYGPPRLSAEQLSAIQAARDPVRHLSERLGRQAAPAEAWEAVAIIRDLVMRDADNEMLEILPSVEHMLEWPILQIEPARKAELRELIDRRKPSLQYGGEVILPLRTSMEPTAPARSKLSSQADWEDADWRACSDRLNGAGLFASAFARNRNDWERTQMYYALQHGGALGENRRAAVVTEHLDKLVPLLSEDVGALDIYPIGPGAEGHTLAEWRSMPRAGRIDRISVCQTEFADAATGSYHAIVCPGNVALKDGIPGFVRLLRQAETLLDEGGLVVLSAETVVNRPAYSSGLGAAHLLDGKLDAVLRDHTSLCLAPPSDLSLDIETFNRMARVGTREVTRPHFVVREPSGEIHTNLVLVLTRHASRQERPSDWDAVAQWLSLPANDILARMSRAPRAVVVEGGIRIGAGSAGHAIYGPYIQLPMGDYELAITGAIETPSAGDAWLRVEVVANNEDILIEKSFTAKELQDRIALTFAVFADAGMLAGNASKFEFRIFAEEDVEATVTRIELTHRGL